MRSASVTLGLLFLSSAAAAQQYVISTYAGGALPPAPASDGSIGAPMGIATDATGNVFFVSPILNSVFKLGPNGMLTRSREHRDGVTRGMAGQPTARK